MYKRLFSGFFTAFLFAASIFLISVISIKAQQTPTRSNPPTIDKSKKETGDDVLILANVSADELKFEVVPNTKVEFPGTHERETVWESERQNLPKSVEPGVTYRNIGIQLRISSRFADIERIVAEALGEIPITDSAPKDGAANDNPPASISETKSEKPKTLQAVPQTKPRRK